jgi:hypothetical protein
VANDGLADSNQALVQINVAPVNDAASSTTAARQTVLQDDGASETSPEATSTISAIADTTPNTSPVATDDAVSASNDDQQRP